MVANKANRIVDVIRRTFDFLDEENGEAALQVTGTTSLRVCKLYWYPYARKRKDNVSSEE